MGLLGLGVGQRHQTQESHYFPTSGIAIRNSLSKVEGSFGSDEEVLWRVIPKPQNLNPNPTAGRT